MNKGLEIKRLRTMKGLTQLQLAQKLFVDAATISKYERNMLDVKTNFLLKTLTALDINPTQYIKDLVEDYNISLEVLSKITYIEFKNIKDIELINDLSIIENVLNNILIHIRYKDITNKYCFNRGEIVSLSDIDDWYDIKDIDKKSSAKFKIISRELDEDDNQYYSVISLQTNEIFEGYASNFESV